MRILNFATLSPFEMQDDEPPINGPPGGRTTNRAGENAIQTPPTSPPFQDAFPAPTAGVSVPSAKTLATGTVPSTPGLPSPTSIIGQDTDPNRFTLSSISPFSNPNSHSLEVHKDPSTSADSPLPSNVPTTAVTTSPTATGATLPTTQTASPNTNSNSEDGTSTGSNQNPSTISKSKPGGLTPGAKAGIAVGVIAAVVLLAALLFWLFQRQKKKHIERSRHGDYNFGDGSGVSKEIDTSLGTSGEMGIMRKPVPGVHVIETTQHQHQHDQQPYSQASAQHEYGDGADRPSFEYDTRGGETLDLVPPASRETERPVSPVTTVGRGAGQEGRVVDEELLWLEREEAKMKASRAAAAGY